MESNKPVFERKQESLICYVDILARDVEKISNWLIGKVKNNAFLEDNIDKTL